MALLTKFKFVSEPEDELLCLICLEVAKEPWQHSDCGRLLCKKCLDKLGNDEPCPSCRMQQPQYFPDSRGKRTIRALPVKCGNADCEWEGTVATLEEHMASCKLTSFPCPNHCQQTSTAHYYTRQQLEQHLREECPNRDYTCKYCREEGTHTYILHTHDKTCAKKVLTCKCFKSMLRQDIDQHLETECEYTVIACKYAGLGCGRVLERKEMKAHEEDDKLHLHMAIDTIALLKTKNTELLTFKVTEYQRNKEKNSLFASPSTYTSPDGYHINIKVYVNGSCIDEDSYVSVFACFLEGDNDDKLTWPFVGDITFTLLNQLEDDNHFSKTVVIKSEHNIGLLEGTFNNIGNRRFITPS